MTLQQFTRQIATPLLIGEALNATLVTQESNEPAHIITKDGRKIFRLSVIAIVVQKEAIGNITNLLVDDGSGQVMVRCFEQSSVLDRVQVGNTVLLIGKMRSYNQEPYFSLEIIRPQDTKWLEVRKLQLGRQKEEISQIQQENLEEVTQQPQKDIAQEEGQVQEQDELVMLPNEKLLAIIKELDFGDGAVIEEVVERSPLSNSQQILDKMLEDGEIFQNQPGRVKVL